LEFDALKAQLRDRKGDAVATLRPPRFRANSFSTCTRFPTARGSTMSMYADEYRMARREHYDLFACLLNDDAGAKWECGGLLRGKPIAYTVACIQNWSWAVLIFPLSSKCQLSHSSGPVFKVASELCSPCCSAHRHAK
jgi:hypothetical protein